MFLTEVMSNLLTITLLYLFTTVTNITQAFRAVTTKQNSAVHVNQPQHRTKHLIYSVSQICETVLIFSVSDFGRKVG